MQKKNFAPKNAKHASSKVKEKQENVVEATKIIKSANSIILQSRGVSKSHPKDSTIQILNDLLDDKGSPIGTLIIRQEEELCCFSFGVKKSALTVKILPNREQITYDISTRPGSIIANLSFYAKKDGETMKSWESKIEDSTKFAKVLEKANAIEINAKLLFNSGKIVEILSAKYQIYEG